MRLGSVGFHAPDPSGPISPNIIQAIIANNTVWVLEAKSGKSCLINRGDWMSLAKMQRTTTERLAAIRDLSREDALIETNIVQQRIEALVVALEFSRSQLSEALDVAGVLYHALGEAASLVDEGANEAYFYKRELKVGAALLGFDCDDGAAETLSDARDEVIQRLADGVGPTKYNESSMDAVNRTAKRLGIEATDEECRLAVDLVDRRRRADQAERNAGG
ncbi:MAG: hypothetical protein Q8K45_02155 [Rubrivivax sp.]|nr:hypothetical protein [Rubrivivax sp.]